MKDFMDVNEASQCVPHSTRTITECCRKTELIPGELPPLKAHKNVQGRWIITAADLQAWMEAQLS